MNSWEIAKDEFEILFGEKGTQCGEKAQHLAVSSGLEDCQVRSICWRFFLGMVLGEPSVDWLYQIGESRIQYEDKKQQFLVDPHEGEEENLETENPLSVEEGSKWNTFFLNKSVESVLHLDLNRLFPDNPFFRQKKVMETIRTVLLIWIREHSDLGYCQGMHEILGGLYYVFSQTSCRSPEAKHYPLSSFASFDISRNETSEKKDKEEGDSMDKPESENTATDDGNSNEQESSEKATPTLPSNPTTTEIIDILLDPEYLEHDLFTCFSVIIPKLSKWMFDTSKKEEGSYGGMTFPSSTSYHGQSGRGAGFRPTSYSRASALEVDELSGAVGVGELEKVTPLIRASRGVQLLVRRQDKTLCDKLEKVDLGFHIFLMQWMRVMYLREFELKEALRLWDAVFACGDSLRMLEWIAVSMILSKRKALMDGDIGMCLNTLKNFEAHPGDENRFVHEAYQMSFPGRSLPPQISLRKSIGSSGNEDDGAKDEDNSGAASAERSSSPANSTSGHSSTTPSSAFVLPSSFHGEAENTTSSRSSPSGSRSVTPSPSPPLVTPDSKSNQHALSTPNSSQKSNNHNQRKSGFFGSKLMSSLFGSSNTLFGPSHSSPGHSPASGSAHSSSHSSEASSGTSFSSVASSPLHSNNSDQSSSQAAHSLQFSAVSPLSLSSSSANAVSSTFSPAKRQQPSIALREARRIGSGNSTDLSAASLAVLEEALLEDDDRMLAASSRLGIVRAMLMELMKMEEAELGGEEDKHKEGEGSENEEKEKEKEKEKTDEESGNEPTTSDSSCEKATESHKSSSKDETERRLFERRRSVVNTCCTQLKSLTAYLLRMSSRLPSPPGFRDLYLPLDEAYDKEYEEKQKEQKEQKEQSQSEESNEQSEADSKESENTQSISHSSTRPSPQLSLFDQCTVKSYEKWADVCSMERQYFPSWMKEKRINKLVQKGAERTLGRRIEEDAAKKAEDEKKEAEEKAIRRRRMEAAKKLANETTANSERKSGLKRRNASLTTAPPPPVVLNEEAEDSKEGGVANVNTITLSSLPSFGYFNSVAANVAAQQAEPFFADADNPFSENEGEEGREEEGKAEEEEEEDEETKAERERKRKEEEEERRRMEIEAAEVEAMLNQKPKKAVVLSSPLALLEEALKDEDASHAGKEGGNKTAARGSPISMFASSTDGESNEERRGEENGDDNDEKETGLFQTDDSVLDEIFSAQPQTASNSSGSAASAYQKKKQAQRHQTKPDQGSLFEDVESSDKNADDPLSQ
ncbi:Tre-2/Bub2/Cdc16 (TBC) F family protein B [Monocercomonoides exilis]|uniref:Tre-2/Bub2/Cdc16 (TBC) F family protein B n=1 Tax=Monocercomonoides exilis TaxID=2049356 RepID=UPI003559BB2C|nr:Tre-2/Bub2/Cdc16 (TBC) F family protein B [Monocercomonoides exilis]|eukprot:MONOS_1627.1-p1 / transcript=MONOS_1627.1 / gene=MONOS_1627 / organism=Monocercomonoides_exilis_PA203 / gene_product=Tre-2/Bub2/Cdc16 (TBC) F family protein B / transcript_product=Tre-2/Bub2/Cdc16 (TBC) F family protein B / location=Mono_scaffold00029:169347-173185(+) / protein_length=1260 / sequence_SO=supercontig / SO=protein_coding / is_pseudo=false